MVPARRTCELRGHTEPHVDDDSLRLTLLLSFLNVAACMQRHLQVSFPRRPARHLPADKLFSREPAVSLGLSLLSCLRYPGSTTL